MVRAHALVVGLNFNLSLSLLSLVSRAILHVFLGVYECVRARFKFYFCFVQLFFRPR